MLKWTDALTHAGGEQRSLVERIIRPGHLLRLIFISRPDEIIIVDVQWHGDPSGEPWRPPKE